MPDPIETCELPASALLHKYLDNGAYADCYVTEIATTASLAEYVEAFYTTAPFKLERFILKWAVSKPSSDSDARRLALAEVDSFAAWTVEGRSADQLLLCDFRQSTRSWLMVAPSGRNASGTRLYFGSAVVPSRSKSGQAHMGFVFEALLGFHKLYSRILLGAASSRFRRR